MVWRTIRQRRIRRDSGQVSAVAVTLTLLLVVSYIANYLSTTLPGQMQESEFQHQLAVENALVRLQSTILTEAAHPGSAISVLTPVPLAADSVPPFGGPAVGTITGEATNISQVVNYQLDTVTPVEPNWGVYSSCLPGGAGHCAGNGNVNYANFSGNGTSLSVTVTGGNNSLVYNVNGDNDTLTVSWSGKDQGIVAFVINGSYDKVSFSKSGSDTTVPTMNFYFFGDHDTYTMSLSGSHSSHGGMHVNVRFIGSKYFLCPYDNDSATDQVGTLGSGGSNLNMSVTWWNAIGYVTNPHVTPYPGGSLPSEAITWENTTGFTACPFLQINSAQYHSSFTGGIDVSMNNRYMPPADLSFEEGAVLLSIPGGESLMISAPRFYFNETLSGLVATLNIINLHGTLIAQSGVSTTSISSRVTGVSTSTFGAGSNGVFVATPYFLNVTTYFPFAWYAYFNALNAPFPFGATCQVDGPALSAGFSCLNPPEGRAMTIVAPLYAQQITLNVINAQVQFL